MIVHAGIALVILGFILLSFGTFSDAAFGGLVMIGPIPIAFGSSPSMTALSMVVGIVLLILYLIMWGKHTQPKGDNYTENDDGGDKDRGNHESNDKDNGEGRIVKRDVKGGGVVMIGPIPIIIGTDSRSVIIVLAIALTFLLIRLAIG